MYRINKLLFCLFVSALFVSSVATAMEINRRAKAEQWMLNTLAKEGVKPGSITLSEDSSYDDSTPDYGVSFRNYVFGRRLKYSPDTREEANTVALLIEKGADVGDKNKNGKTPLHVAAYWGKVNVASTLIEKGADVNAEDAKGNTPLHETILLGSVDVAKLLINNKANVNAENKKGRTPLHVAAVWGKVNMARTLIEKEADLYAEDTEGNTPLNLAKKENMSKMVRLLIEKEASSTPKP